MIRVLIVDDQPVVRVGVARILSEPDGFEVVGECTDGDEVLPSLRHSRPDVVLMDIRMHRMDGITVTRELRQLADAPPVLILTTFDDDDALWGALDAGAAGFILKDCPAEDMIVATRAVASGGAWLDPRVTPRVLAAARGAERGTHSSHSKTGQLTDRELDVLRHMARGANNREIARELIVSEATVKSHVGAIFSKLGVRDRAAAIVFAFDHGIVDPHPRADGDNRP